jgi:hypothetical protein
LDATCLSIDNDVESTVISLELRERFLENLEPRMAEARKGQEDGNLLAKNQLLVS